MYTSLNGKQEVAREKLMETGLKLDISQIKVKESLSLGPMKAEEGETEGIECQQSKKREGLPVKDMTLGKILQSFQRYRSDIVFKCCWKAEK